MKRVLYFIGLKVVEVAGVVVGLFVLYWPGWLWLWKINGQKEHWAVCVFMGFFVVFLICLVIGLLYELVKANWKKAGKLAKKP